MRTIKKDTNNHGIGIKSVRKLVQGMDGFCLWEEYENRFSVTVILPEHANRAGQNTNRASYMENMTKSAKIVDKKHYFSAFMDTNISFYYYRL